MSSNSIKTLGLILKFGETPNILVCPMGEFQQKTDPLEQDCIYRQLCSLLSNIFAPLLTAAFLVLVKKNVTEYIFSWEDKIDKKGSKDKQKIDIGC